MQKKQKVTIRGMHCKSCELLIEQKFSSLPGVSRVNVSQARETATLIVDHELPLTVLNEALTGTEYSIHPNTKTFGAKVQEKTQSVAGAPRYFSLRDFGASILIIIALYLITKKLNVIPQFDVSSTMSISVAFFTGLVAAFSSCIAVTGSLLMAMSARYSNAHPNTTQKNQLKLHSAFHAGRLISYTVLGALLGALGNALALSSVFFGVVIILTSIVMIILGLKMLNLFPFLQKFTFTLPTFIGRRVTEQSGSGLRSAFLFGGATFFFPCGFTQALQLYVIAQGSTLQGALIMGMFALGTLPALASVGFISSLKHRAIVRHFHRFAGALVLVVGLTSINNGMVLAGVQPLGNYFYKPNAARAMQNITTSNGVQIAYLKVDGLDYFPNVFTVQKGMPVEWRIDGRTARGCARVIAAPDLGVMERLKSDGETVIRFTPTRIGTILFSCSMGMAGPGQFTVIEKSAGNNASPTSPQVPCDSSLQQCYEQ